MWVALLFAHLIGNTGYNITLRHSLADKKIDSILLSAVMSTAIAIPAVIGIIICGGVDFARYSANEVWGFVGFVAFTVAFHILNSKALERTEAGTFSFLYNLRIGVASLMGIAILGEVVNVLRLVGGGMVFVAGFIIMGHLRTSGKGAALSVCAAVSIVFVNLFEKSMIATVGYANIIFPTAIVITVILWLVVAIRKTPIPKRTLTGKNIIALMPFRCMSAYGFTLALSFGALLSVGTYISSLAFITTSLAGIIFLKERGHIRAKIVAAMVALAGVTLIFLSSV